MNRTRILVVDDHPILRRALIEVIGDEADLEVVGQASNGQEAVEQARSLAPDLVLMDLLMPGKDGVQATQEIHAENPDVKILVLSSSVEGANVLAAIQAGAMGYLCKEAQPQEILTGIRSVARDGMYLPPAIAARLVKGIQQGTGEMAERRPVKAGDTVPLRELTGREQEIMGLLGQGLSNRIIAQKLTLSEATVRSHVYHILYKLGLEDRGQAIVYALRPK